MAKTKAEFERRVAAAPRFNLYGKITDRSDDSLMLWGGSTPLNHDWTQMGALPQDGNVIVLNPQKQGILGGLYYRGQHYYLEKRSVANGFGAEVPAYVFGDMPPDIAALRNQCDALQRQLDALEVVKSQKRVTATDLAPSPVTGGSK